MNSEDIKKENRSIVEVIKMLGIYHTMINEPFRARAYENAADTLSNIENIRERVETHQLQNLEGIGETIEKKISEFLQTGKICKLEEFKKEIPIDILELNRIEGLGPKTMFKLYKELGVADIASLKQACLANQVAPLERMGTKSQEKLLNGIKNLGL